MSGIPEERVIKVEVADVRLGKKTASVDKGANKPNVNIFPEDEIELDREIYVGNSAIIGRIFGRAVTMAQGDPSKGVTEAYSIVGIEKVKLEGYCHVNGPVISLGQIDVGPFCSITGDLFGSEITIDKKCQIKGNVISNGNINVIGDSMIFGYLCSLSGGVSLGDDCLVFDVISSKDLLVGEKTIILDSVIWTSGGTIDIDQNIKLNALIDPKIVDQYMEFYDSIEGVQRASLDLMSPPDKKELNTHWSIMSEDEATRELKLNILRKKFSELYGIGWEIYK